MRDHLSADAHDAPYELKVPMTPIDLEIYKELMDHLSDGVFIADVDRRILYCNEAAFRLTGYKAEEIEGHICRDKGFCPIGHLAQHPCHEECPLETALRDGLKRRPDLQREHLHCSKKWRSNSGRSPYTAYSSSQQLDYRRG